MSTKTNNEGIDEIFKEIGEFGKYQLFLLVSICFISTLPAITGYSFVFSAAIPDFRLFYCRI